MSTKLKRFDRVVITEDTFGFKKGTNAIFVGAEYKSGYPVYAVALVDDDILDFFDKNNFKSFDDYIRYQQNNNTFGDQFWTNPFTIFYPDQDKVIGHSQLIESIEEKRKAIESLENEILELNGFKKDFDNFINI